VRLDGVDTEVQPFRDLLVGGRQACGRRGKQRAAELDQHAALGGRDAGGGLHV
jgi:hypothetical protein